MVSSVLFLIFNINPLFCNAQAGGPGGDDFAGDPDAPVPIDGGLTILVAAGIGYGLKKANDKRIKNKSVDFTEINR